MENDNNVANSYIISVRPCDFKDIFEKNGTINMCRLGSGIIPAMILVTFSNNLSAEDEVCFRNMCYDYGKKNKGEGIVNGIILQVMYRLIYVSKILCLEFGQHSLMCKFTYKRQPHYCKGTSCQTEVLPKTTQLQTTIVKFCHFKTCNFVHPYWQILDIHHPS